jgi:hypothetical protein
MECYGQKNLHIGLYDEELNTMANIVRLAHERIETSTDEQMRGTPVIRRAGLVGPELFAVRNMIQRIATNVGLTLIDKVTDEPLPGATRELVTIEIVRGGPQAPREAT